MKHSLSPLIHGAWMREYGIAGKYEKLETPPSGLAETLKKLEREKFTGVNITIPHKEAALAAMTEISAEARAIGAINTVHFRQDGAKGYNTDAYGFIASLKERTGKITPYLKHAAVLGAGGAARAVIYGLLQEGAAHITLLNRTQEKAQALADGEIIRIAPWEDRSAALRGITLLVNTTSLGMEGQPALGLSLDYVPREALVADIVYVPRKTALICAAEKRGNKTVSGLGMLLHQAARAFEIWTGITPDVNTGRQAVETAI